MYKESAWPDMAGLPGVLGISIVIMACIALLGAFGVLGGHDSHSAVYVSYLNSNISGETAMLSDFEGGGVDFRLEKYGKNHGTDEGTILLEANLDRSAPYAGSQSLRLSFNFGEPITGTPKHIKAIKAVRQDWSRFEYLNFAVKGDGRGGRLYLWVVDGDGDWWYYSSDHLLYSTDWNLVTVPLDQLSGTGPNFPYHGDGNKDFHDVAEYRIRIEQPVRETNGADREIYLDSIFLGR
ncbi:MAG: carbohydrate binding domain-containing protein [archaeon]